jgi:protein gp37
MAENSAIEWTDHTWSPWEGCTKVSPGCDHCYAEGMNRWLRKGENWGPAAPRRTYSDEHWEKPLRWNAAAGKAGKQVKVFPSVCDPFDNAAPEGERGRFWRLIEATPRLTWLLLTKRIGNAMAMIPEHWALQRLPRHVWIGATMVNQEERDRDLRKLLAVPATVHFLSLEPLLGPIRLDLPQGHVGQSLVDWVIVGGESGTGARPMHPDWARSLRDQCAEAGVPFLFKQHGEWAPGSGDFGRGAFKTAAVDMHGRVVRGGYEAPEYPKGSSSADGWAMVHQAGKKAAGRLLDGVEHNGFPTPVALSRP